MWLRTGEHTAAAGELLLDEARARSARLADTLEQAGALGSLAASEVIAHWGPRPMTPLKDLAAQHGLTVG